ncbi:hypothetical protein BGX24_003878 [Mortierella sp. AD032]|nr:hypothetical protein BGX24_003878 [Mortierella sp. AD032]
MLQTPDNTQRQHSQALQEFLQARIPPSPEPSDEPLPLQNPRKIITSHRQTVSMKFLFITLLLASSALAQCTTYTFPENAEGTGMTMGCCAGSTESICNRVFACHGNSTNVTCAGQSYYDGTTMSVMTSCRSTRYRNGRKLASDGECCHSDQDCQSSCKNFICSSK